jgi:hypothetical protein
MKQGVTKRCRLSWLTNSALVEPKCGGRGGSCGVSANEYSCAVDNCTVYLGSMCTWSPNKLWRSNSGSQPMSTAVHNAWSPNKLWRSNSIFNLWLKNQPQLTGHAPIILVPGAGGTTCRNITDDRHRRQPKDDPVWVCPGAPPLSAHNAVRKEPRAPTLFLPHFLAKNCARIHCYWSAPQLYILRSWWKYAKSAQKLYNLWCWAVFFQVTIFLFC